MRSASKLPSIIGIVAGLAAGAALLDNSVMGTARADEPTAEEALASEPQAFDGRVAAKYTEAEDEIVFHQIEVDADGNVLYDEYLNLDEWIANSERFVGKDLSKAVDWSQYKSNEEKWEVLEELVNGPVEERTESAEGQENGGGAVTLGGCGCYTSWPYSSCGNGSSRVALDEDSYLGTPSSSGPGSSGYSACPTSATLCYYESGDDNNYDEYTNKFNITFTYGFAATKWGSNDHCSGADYEYRDIVSFGIKNASTGAYCNVPYLQIDHDYPHGGCYEFTTHGGGSYGVGFNTRFWCSPNDHGSETAYGMVAAAPVIGGLPQYQSSNSCWRHSPGWASDTY